jgi:hypothetical protein
VGFLARDVVGKSVTSIRKFLLHVGMGLLRITLRIALSILPGLCWEKGPELEKIKV